MNIVSIIKICIILVHVDAFSRNPCCTVIQDNVLSPFLKAPDTDEHITAIQTILKDSPCDDFIVKNTVLYTTDLFVVLETMHAYIIK